MVRIGLGIALGVGLGASKLLIADCRYWIHDHKKTLPLVQFVISASIL